MHASPLSDVVIVAASRSPIGRAYKGSLIHMRPDDLLAQVLCATLSQIDTFAPNTLDDLIVGCAQPAGESGYNIARVVTLLTGLQDVPGTTVNRYCASSLQAIRMGAHAIACGEAKVVATAGVETVSRFDRGKSDGLENTKNPAFSANDTSLPDIYISMGETAEIVAESHGITRKEMDAFAMRSQMRAVQAQEQGIFNDEITPITLPTGDLATKDDGPRPDTSIERLATLKPVFRENGRVTAGNACPLNDGAAAVVLMHHDLCKELKIKPLGRIISTGLSALRPEKMGLGPIEASRRAMRAAGLTMADIDLVEINEAFAAQVIPSARELSVDDEKLNVHGGAIALGHPFGMTGARIMTTLLNALRHRDKTIGLETMCVGGGQGMAIIVERLN